MLRDDWDVRASYAEKDNQHWARLQECVAQEGISYAEMWSNFSAFIRRRDLAVLLARYELFKMIQALPGSIAELGVYLGASLFTWSNLLETFSPGDRTRRVYGFEHGSGYVSFTTEDREAEAYAARCIGDKQVSQGYLETMVDLHNADNFLPGVERCRIIAGDIAETVPQFAQQSLGTRLSLLHLDVNLYEPTLVGLKHLYPLMVSGGVVALNAYGGPPWEGEVTAFEEYFKVIGRPQPTLYRLAFSPLPGGYFVK